MKTLTGMTMGVLLCVCLCSGCANIKKNNYNQFYAHQPRSIVIVPIMNETTEISAPNMLIITISQVLGERGYYVFPVHLTETLLHDIGLPEAGLIHQLPPQDFYKHFGADAVLFITIKDWAAKYVLLQNIRTVQARYLLVDTKQALTLWDQTETVQVNSGGNSVGAMIANAVVEKIASEVGTETYFLPLAAAINQNAINKINTGLPRGPYHSEYGKDHGQYPAQ